MRRVVIAPQVQHADEIGFRIGKRCMGGISLLPCLRWTFAWILHAEEADDRQQLAQAVQFFALDQHPRQLHIDWQPCEHAADRGEFAHLVDRRNFGEAPVAVRHHARIGRFQKRKVLNLTELQRQHAQDHVGQ